MDFWITSTVLILALGLLRRIFRGRVSARLLYALWLLVAVKLLTQPFAVYWESPLSILNLTDTVETLLVEHGGAALWAVTENTTIRDDAVTENAGVQNDAVTGGTAALNGSAASGDTDAAYDSIVSDAAATDGSAAGTEENEWMDAFGQTAAIVRWLPFLLRMVALAALCWLTAYNLYFYLFLRRRRVFLEKKAHVKVYGVAHISSPFLFGTSIYLDESKLDGEQKKYAITHEYFHCVHMDFLWSALRLFLVAVYWYDPFVWLAARWAKEDSELACDEAVVARLGEDERLSYGRALVDMIQKSATRFDFFSVATGMRGGKREMKTRITLIVEKKKCRGFFFAVALSLAAFITVATFTGCMDSRKNQTETVENRTETAAKQTETVKDQTGTVGNQTETTESQAESDTVENRTLTMEDVISGFRMGTLENFDYLSYGNGEINELGESLTRAVQFELNYDNEEYRLDVYFWKENDQLKNVILNKTKTGDAALLYTSEVRYTIVEDLDAFLATKNDVSDWLTIELPEGYELSAYNAYVGVAGGALIEPLAYETVGGEDASAPDEWTYSGVVARITDAGEWFAFENGSLTEKKVHFWNHMSDEKVETLDGLEVPAVLYHGNCDLYTAAEIETLRQAGYTLPDEETTSDYWYIYFAVEGEDEAYYIALAEKLFTQEEAVEIAKTVHFTNGYGQEE